jgi:hypothetical protein
MFRKLVLAAAFAAIALPAAAHTEVKVSLVGLDAKAAHAAIVQAAQAACREELAGESTLVQFYTRPDCVNTAVAKAETTYSNMRGLASR